MNSLDFIVKMFADDNDTYEHSDDEEIEEHLARQCISNYQVKSHLRPLTNSSTTFQDNIPLYVGPMGS